MSPEQTIMVANNCEDYKKDSKVKHSAKYLSKFQSCKNCSNWHVGQCEKAQDILNTIE